MKEQIEDLRRRVVRLERQNRLLMRALLILLLLIGISLIVNEVRFGKHLQQHETPAPD